VNLTEIKTAKIPRKYKFIKGRGHSSGVGKTCGRGRKGQYARQGERFRAYFEGGQMPIIRRLPKFGFNNKEFKTVFELVNVSQLETLFSAGQTVDEAALRAKGLVRRVCDGIKVLGTGTLTKKLAIKVSAVTAQAEQKILKAGGSVERLMMKKEKALQAKAAAQAAKKAANAAKAKPAAK
jgi:large subunit ribosomal protein L15